MEKKMEDDTETGVLIGLSRDKNMYLEIQGNRLR